MVDVNQMVKDLKKRGWSDEDIKKVVEVYSSHDQSKRTTMIIIYWLALLVTIVANFLVTVVVILFLITLPLPLLYLIVILIAFGFGSLLLLLLKDIRRLDPEHYVLISIFFPSMAFINVFIITTVANIMKVSLDLVIPNPLAVSLVYVYAFSAPYLYLLLKEGFTEEKDVGYWLKGKKAKS